MALLLSNRDGGKTDENGHYRFHVKAWSGNILSGFAVTQNSPLGMSVLVGTGDARVDYSTYGYTLWNDASAVATITTADPSNPRIDRVVVYIDRGATPQTVTPNNPGIPKIAVVAGTAAGSPTKASDAAVQSVVGSGNPWFEIATVAVAAGVTTISNANITDTRSFVKAPANSVNTAAIANDAVTNDKMGMTGSADANGWTVYDFGGFKHYRKRVTFSGSWTSGTAAVASLSSTNLPTGMSTLSTNAIFMNPSPSGLAGNIKLTTEMTSSSAALNIIGYTTATSGFSGFIDLLIIS